jgi:Holliday junction resolvase
MRQAAKTDTNQKLIVDALRDAGVDVLVLSMVGHGTPDILCGFQGVNVLLEIKDGKGTLTDDELDFIDHWSGPVYIARTPQQAIDIMRGVAR